MNDRPLTAHSVVTDDGLVELFANKIYANLHHLMRVTGTEALAAYESAARSIITASDRDVLVGENARLREALNLAVPIIEEERQVCFDSNVVGALRHPDLGKVIDPYALAELAKYDEALSKARAALIPLAEGHPS